MLKSKRTLKLATSLFVATAVVIVPATGSADVYGDARQELNLSQEQARKTYNEGVILVKDRVARKSRIAAKKCATLKKQAKSATALRTATQKCKKNTLAIKKFKKNSLKNLVAIRTQSLKDAKEKYDQTIAEIENGGSGGNGGNNPPLTQVEYLKQVQQLETDYNFALEILNAEVEEQETLAQQEYDQCVDSGKNENTCYEEFEVKSEEIEEWYFSEDQRITDQWITLRNELEAKYYASLSV